MNLERPLRFHWSLSQAGNPLRRASARDAMSGRPDFKAQVTLCRQAEACGIESMLMAIGSTRPDPILLSVALGRATRRIGFMIACRPGLVSPPFFVQQLNTLSQRLPGRVAVNVVVGHTPGELGYYGCFHEHDQRFDQAEEFLSICRALWLCEPAADGVSYQGRYYDVRDARLGIRFAQRSGPEIYLGGNSARAAELATKHASCLFRFAEPPESLRPQLEPVLAAGKEVGLLVALIGRPTHYQAMEAAWALVDGLGAETHALHHQLQSGSDSVAFRSTYKLARGTESGWLTDHLWAGAVPYLGPPSIALVGSFEEIAEAILDYRRIGVSQFLFLGWPDLEEMTTFGNEILPLIRRRESSERGRKAPCD